MGRANEIVGTVSCGRGLLVGNCSEYVAKMVFWKDVDIIVII